MDIDTLLGHSADDIAAMSDEELDKILMPYYNVTRPELAPKPQQLKMQQSNPALFSGVAEAAKLGLDLSYLLKKGKRK